MVRLTEKNPPQDWSVSQEVNSERVITQKIALYQGCPMETLSALFLTADLGKNKYQKQNICTFQLLFLKSSYY